MPKEKLRIKRQEINFILQGWIKFRWIKSCHEIAIGEVGSITDVYEWHKRRIIGRSG